MLKVLCMVTGTVRLDGGWMESLTIRMNDREEPVLVPGDLLVERTGHGKILRVSRQRPEEAIEFAGQRFSSLEIALNRHGTPVSSWLVPTSAN